MRHTSFAIVFFLILIGFTGYFSVYATEPKPVGINVLNYGIFEANNDDDEDVITHELVVGQEYKIKTHFESELDVSVPFSYTIQIIDKNKLGTEIVDEFKAESFLQPDDQHHVSFGFIPQYAGSFRTFAVFTNILEGATIGAVPQYDFEVALSEEQVTPSNDVDSDLLEAQKSMRKAFSANVDVKGFPIKDIVIGHGIGDGKYIVDVNADFFDSKYWPDVQENLTSIIGNKVEIKYVKGEPLNICGKGTVFEDGVCKVINPKSEHENMSQGDMAFLIGVTLLVIVVVIGVIYYRRLDAKR